MKLFRNEIKCDKNLAYRTVNDQSFSVGKNYFWRKTREGWFCVVICGGKGRVKRVVYLNV